MKRYELNLKHCASLLHLPKLTIALAVLLAMGMSMSLNADAQRGGSGHGSMGRSGGSHMSSGVSRSSGSVSRMSPGVRSMSPGVRGMSRTGSSRIGSAYARGNNVRGLSGNYGHHGFSGRGYGFRGLPYWRYGYLPFWGDYFWGIPPYSMAFYLDGYNYYDCDGVYYKKDNDKYQVVAAPVGTRVKELPKNSLEFTLDGAPYYYYFGTFYVPVNGQFEIVEPPLGAEVDSIPDGYDKVMIDGQTYYTLEGIQYKAVLRDNAIWYQVIKNNNDNPAPANPAANDQPVQKNDIEHK
jgi:hypothetical protein